MDREPMDREWFTLTDRTGNVWAKVGVDVGAQDVVLLDAAGTRRLRVGRDQNGNPGLVIYSADEQSAIVRRGGHVDAGEERGGPDAR